MCDCRGFTARLGSHFRQGNSSRRSGSLNSVIPAAVCKSLETTVESAIVSGMVGELGTDPDDQTDKGVKCYIDPDQVVVATSKVNVQLRVKPFGYLKYIDVYLGFLVE